MKKRLQIAVLCITAICFGQTYEGMEFYENGKPKSIKTYKESNEKFELIEYISLYGNGQKSKKETYKNGKPNGKWTEWHSNGQKSKEGTYKDGLKNGNWTEWYENGHKKDEGTFKGSIKDGKWIGWNENGTMKYEGNFKDGKKHGKYKGYYEDDEYIRSGVSKNKIGDIHTIIDYIDNKIHGSFLKFHEGQLVIKENYKQGLSEKGIWYHSNGQKLGEYNYKDGEYDGLQTEWYENGQKKRENTYKNDVLVDSKCWDENGNECECSEKWWKGCK